MKIDEKEIREEIWYIAWTARQEINYKLVNDMYVYLSELNGDVVVYDAVAELNGGERMPLKTWIDTCMYNYIGTVVKQLGCDCTIHITRSPLTYEIFADGVLKCKTFDEEHSL